MENKAQELKHQRKKLYSVVEEERDAIEGNGKYDELLRSRRLELGLSMQQVAKLAGISLPQYQKFEYKTRSLANCSMRVGLAICAALKIDPRDLTY
ncbi:MAG: helix-turn-helix transcriptional regulator [Clostridia bacterium]|nr:helix-turn-helix transcriptional regulator [Clostridia bacterium]